jgi:enoyl-[acyl-carrier-protein] reductase (NADH)
MFTAPFEDVATAMHISTYSLATLVGAFRPLLQKSEALGGASVIALDFDGTRAYPLYDWMGVMKAGLESLGRYLAREVGPDKIRVNMLAAGPIRTIAAKSIPGFSLFEDDLGARRPRSAGTSTTRAPWPTPPSRCCHRCCARRPRRSSTSTAARTRWASPPSAPLPVLLGTNWVS